MDVVRRGQPLQDVVRVEVMAEEQDLVVHAEEPTFWKLERKEESKRSMVTIHVHGP